MSIDTLVRGQDFLGRRPQASKEQCSVRPPILPKLSRTFLSDLQISRAIAIGGGLDDNLLVM